MAERVVHLSSVAGSPLVDSGGARLGRVQDVIAQLGSGGALPHVTGLKAQIGGRELFVPIDRVARLGPGAAQTSTTKLNLAHFERRPGEVLLRSDILDHSLIDVRTARLVAAHDVELSCDEGVWRVAGIDPSFRARLRRLCPRRFREYEGEHDSFVGWSELEPFVAHVPTSRLRLGHRRLAQLHPAQIADLVEAASHAEGEEILEALGHDKELEADIFEELDDAHQLEFLRERSDNEVAALLARMEPDDAADLVMSLDQDRRLPVLNLLPPAKQRKIRGLLGHNPQTAGGLMNPDFVAVAERSTVEQVLETVRRSELPAEQVHTVLVLDQDGKLAGGMPVATLVRADPHEALAGLVDETGPAVSAEADVPEIARVMTDFNLMSLPVLDAEGRPIGVLAVDDILELLLPEEWRRRHGSARD
jgi:CBS domain-containing protein